MDFATNSNAAVAQPPMEAFLSHFKIIDDNQESEYEAGLGLQESDYDLTEYDLEYAKKPAAIDYYKYDKKPAAIPSMHQDVHSLPTPAQLTGKRKKEDNNKKARVFSMSDIIFLSLAFFLMIGGIAIGITFAVRTVGEEKVTSMYVYGDDDEAPKNLNNYGAPYKSNDDDGAVAALPKKDTDRSYKSNDDDEAVAASPKKDNEGKVVKIILDEAKAAAEYAYGSGKSNDDDGAVAELPKKDTDSSYKSNDDDEAVAASPKKDTTGKFAKMILDEVKAAAEYMHGSGMSNDDDGEIAVFPKKDTDRSYKSNDDDGEIAALPKKDTKPDRSRMSNDDDGEIAVSPKKDTKPNDSYKSNDDDGEVAIKVNEYNNVVVFDVDDDDDGDANDIVSRAVGDYTLEALIREKGKWKENITKQVGESLVDPYVFESNMINYLTKYRLSSESDLNNPDSGQLAAVQWLANENLIDIPNDESSILIHNEFITRYAMITMYFATNGERWSNKLNFLSGSHVCDWFGIIATQEISEGSFNTVPRGVACDENGFIEALFLDENKLSGTIPPELRLLPSLRAINFDKNDINGIIPDFFLKELQHISIAHNRLTGTLPKNMMASLETMDLSNNYITGTIPASSFDWLHCLALDNNLLTGSIKQTFGGSVSDDIVLTPNIAHLYLEANDFTDTLDDQFLTKLVNLESLDISDNDFKGTLPDHFFTMENLYILDLHNNAIEGTLPSTISSNKILQVLAVHENNIGGQIPESIGDNFNELIHLDLSANEFEGTIPESIGFLSNLNYLFLAQNSLFINAPIPGSLKHLTNLVDLSLKETSRTGIIPDFIGEELTKLALLDLDLNDIVGSIPSSIGNLKQLQLLLLNGNKLTGAVPSELGNLDALRMLYINDNYLKGSFNNLYCNRLATEIMPYIVADCGATEVGAPDIECECCFKCCSATNPCTDHNMLLNKDPMTSVGYEKPFFSFGDRSTYFAI